MQTFKTALTDSIKVNEVDGIIKRRFVKANGMYAGANEKAHGVSQTDADNGEMCAIDVYAVTVVDTGTAVNTTAISVGDPIASDAEGKAVKADTASILNVNGFAVSAANAAGIGLAIKLI